MTQKIKLNRYYDFGYFDKATKFGYREYSYQKMVKGFRIKTRTVQNYCQSGCLLDLGCAKGFFVKVALASGFNSYGVDFSAYAIEHAENPERNRIVNADLEHSIPFKKDTFDIVTGWDFLEHLRNPQDFLKKISETMKVHGYLLLTTVNHDSLMAHLMPNNWRLKATLHLSYYITPKLLKEWLIEAGFQPIVLSSFGLSLKPLPVKLKLLQSVLTMIITGASPLFRVMGLGCYLFCVARKTRK